MKFAKSLEDNVVPEWRSKYIDYKGGKKKIKAITRNLRSNQSPNVDGGVIFKTPKFSGNTPYVHSGNGLAPTPRSILKKSSQSPATIPISVTGPALATPSQIATIPEGLSRITTAPSPGNNDISTQYGAIGASGSTRGGFPDMDFALPEPMQDLTRHNTWTGPTYTDEDRALNLKKRVNTITSIPKRPALMRRVFSSFARKTGGPPGGRDYPLDETSQGLAAAEFNYWVENELHKIDEFYRQKENDAVNRMAALKAQLHAMRDQRLSDLARKREKKMLQDSNDNIQNRPANWMKSVQNLKDSFSSKSPAPTPADERPHSPGMDSLQKITTAPAPFLIGDPKRDYMPGRVKPTNEVPYQTAKRKLKAAVVEYYRGLELLKSYCTHNREGFRKITKKFDKATGLRTSKRFMMERVNKSYFGSSDVLDSMISSTEDLYARYFEKGNRKHAIERLRTREKSKLHYSSMFRSAFALGLSLFAGVSGLVAAVNKLHGEEDEDKKHEIEYLLQIWGGFFLPILFMHFFVMNCRAWAKNKINYVFIFEFDTRHNLDYRQLLEIPALLMLLMTMCMWLNFQNFWPDALPTTYYPILFLCLAGIIIFNPFPILYHQSRKWFATAHFRLLLSGLFPVEFRDFWLGDMFCSLTYTLGNLALFGCLYQTNWDDPPMCNSSHSRGMGFMTALPACWRLLQCLRRYRDTKNAFPHLANAGKYTFTILYYVSLSTWRISDNDKHARAVFVALAIISSVYSTAWDLVMDWSLLNPYAKYPLLRDTLGFKNPLGYYAALVLDPILRFNWILYLIFQHHTQHSAALSFLLSLSEIFRRWMWAFFRLENEHCTNVNCYRASRELPLPYRLPPPTPHAPAYKPIVSTTTATAKVSPLLAAGHSGGDGSSTGIDIESQTRPSFRRRSSIAASPALRALSTVGHVLTKAHAQDFERRRTRIEEDEARTPDDGNETDDEDDDEEENTEAVDYTPSSEEEGRLGDSEVKNGKGVSRGGLANVEEDGGEGSSGEGSSARGSGSIRRR